MCAPGQFHLVAKAHPFGLLGCRGQGSPSVSAVPAGFPSANVVIRPALPLQGLVIPASRTGPGAERWNLVLEFCPQLISLIRLPRM